MATTWNPADKAAGITLSGNNLIATNNNNIDAGVRTVDGQGSGKFYWECTLNVIGAGDGIGIAKSSAVLTTHPSACVNTAAISQSSGTVYVDTVGGNGVAPFGALTNGMVICIALDCTAARIWYRIGAAGNWNNNSGNNPATGVGACAIPGYGGAVLIYPAAWVCLTGKQITANFGGSAFVGAVPAGFNAGVAPGSQARAMVLA